MVFLKQPRRGKPVADNKSGAVFSALTAGIETVPDANCTLAVVADVHGMQPAFERMLALLALEAPLAHVVFVGDLIDRGENSAQVLRRAFDLRAEIEVLLGNHEDMLLQFLDAPSGAAARWLRYGGLQTFSSFGIGGIREGSTAAEMTAARDALRDALGPDLEQWLRARPRFWRRGNVVVTHAGADPRRPIETQMPRDLTWGHADFGKERRKDGLWIVHGHTIVAEPVCARGIISVDTGAFTGGGLSAAVLCGGNVRFLQVPS